MKRFALTVASALLGVLVWAGCGQKRVQVKPDALAKSFATAAPALKGPVDLAVAALRSQKYAEAMNHLRDAVKQGGLTDPQVQAIYDIITQVQQSIAQVSEGPPPALDQAIRALVAELQAEEKG